MYEARVTKTHLVVMQEGVPEQVAHLVRSGTIDERGFREWFHFLENAEGTEPDKSGMAVVTEQWVAEKYGIDISQNLLNFSENEAKNSAMLEAGVHLVLSNIDAHRANINSLSNLKDTGAVDIEKILLKEHIGIAVNAELLKTLTDPSQLVWSQ